jgi:uncharacterized protein YbjT (DUF2867 family)
MTPPVLVTGGTGTLGRLLVPRLRTAGAPVRVLSRHPQGPADGVEFVLGDLDTGDGVAAALAGVDVVVHCAGAETGDEERARALGRAARAAGVRHLVNVSVVGADRMPVTGRADRALFGYFAAKLGAEQAVAASGVPWTTLRATQFHELVLTVVRALTRLPVVPFPSGMRGQPVAAADVADRLAELALGVPCGLAPEVAGPRVYALPDLLRDYLRRTHRRRPLVPVHVPGRAAAAMRAGANLPAGGTVGRRTWEDFLAERVPVG